MKKLKVMSVVGTRPEIIRLSRVLAALDEHCEHVLVHTGQNYDYELNQVFFDDLGVRKPDYFLNSAEGSTGAAHTIGNLIIAVDRVLGEVQPEAMLVLGDTNSCLSVIPAKRRKIPIFHMEAGNRCFDQRVPEETNRRIVDHTADINLTYSTIARDYLLREGLPPDQVIKTGSPMFEVLTHYRPRIEASDVLQRLSLEVGRYFVVSAHRGEHRVREVLHQAGGGAQCGGGRPWPAGDRVDPSAHAEAGGCDRRQVPPDGATAEAAGLSRLREAAAFGQGGAVG